MSELITSVPSRLEFQKYVNRVVCDFKAKESDALDREYEPDGLSLIFPVKKLRCDYFLIFDRDCFFLKLNFEIDDDKYFELRNRFYEKLDFLFTGEKFYSQNENSIVLKSQIDKKLIERAQIIFATERWMKSYFFLETKIALDEIVLMIFEEFKEIIRRIWKTIFENFETFDFSKLFESSKNVSDSFSNNIEKENLYNLPPIVKIYFDSYNQQRLGKVNEQKCIPRKKKNLVQRSYI